MKSVLRARHQNPFPPAAAQPGFRCRQPPGLEYCESGVDLKKAEDHTTVTLNFKPEIEAGLLAQAQASGIVEEYLLPIVEGAMLPAKSTLSPEQRAAAFEAWSANHRATPPLSDYAVSREAMYEGRDH